MLNCTLHLSKCIFYLQVSTASEFLVSPAVQNSSMDMKVAFLKKKGLTDAEIDAAMKQSDARLMAVSFIQFCA